MSERSLRALLDPGLAAGGPAAVAATVVDTARTVFGVPNAALLELRRDLDAVAVTAGAGGSRPVLIGASELPSGLALTTAETERVDGEQALAFGAALRWPDSRGLVFIPLPGSE